MTRRRSISASSRGDHHHHNLHRLHENNEDEDDNMSDNSSETLSTVPKEKRDDLVNPYWIEDPDMSKGEVEYLSSTEIQFWKDLLDKYLYPIDENKSEQVNFKIFSINLQISIKISCIPFFITICHAPLQFIN